MSYYTPHETAGNSSAKRSAKDMHTEQDIIDNINELFRIINEQGRFIDLLKNQQEDLIKRINLQNKQIKALQAYHP